MKFCGVVVLYNPGDEVLDNINSYLDILDKLFVCDNSEKLNEFLLEELAQNNKIELISMNGNKGIAKALKVGMQKAIEDKYDFCLTMDQDSKFPIIDKEYLFSYFKKGDISDYGIIAVNNIQTPNPQHKLIETKTWITSGSFVNVKNYQLIPGFNENLFIDYVDFDINEQFYKVNKKIAYIEDIIMEHHLGNLIEKKFLFKKIHSMNHAPIRYYYRYRNLYYLYRKDKKFYKYNLKQEKRNIIKMLLCEKNRKEKLKMIKRGKKDAKLGILGKYKED